MNEIKLIVKEITKKYMTNNPFELSDYLGLIVVKTPLNALIKGFYQYYRRNRIIYINSLISKEWQTITCAHELGHALLHKKLNIVFLEHNTFYIKDKYENQANKFAAELLINDDLLAQYKGFTIDQIAASEHIPIELLKLKFEKAQNNI